MSIFTASDVLEFAVRMEENGGLFYREAAERSEQGEAKKLFSSLAQEEADHKKIFEGMLSKVTLNDQPEGYPGEFLAYLHNYIDGKIFFTPENKTALSSSNDIASALEFAIQREMDAIHYYQELKSFVSVYDHPTLDKIIASDNNLTVEQLIKAALKNM